MTLIDQRETLALITAADDLNRTLWTLNSCASGTLSYQRDGDAYGLVHAALDQVLAQLLTPAHAVELRERCLDNGESLWWNLSRLSQHTPHWHVSTSTRDCDGPIERDYITDIDPGEDHYTPTEEGYTAQWSTKCYDFGCQRGTTRYRDFFAEQMGY